MERTHQTEPIQVDYHLKWISNIKPQNYKINVEGLKEFFESPNVSEPQGFIGKSFDNFTVKEKQSELVSRLKVWNGKGLIALLSPATGIGKTHLAVATAREYYKSKLYKWFDDNKDTDFGYKEYAVQDFSEYAERNKPLFFSENDLFRNDFGNIEFNFWLKINRVVVIDDLFAGRQTDLTRSALYEMVNTRITNHNLPTIITSNLTLGMIAKIDERIASRLQGEMTFELEQTEDHRRL